MEYTALSSKTHKDLRLKQGTFFFLSDQPLVPVSVVEAPRAALDLPLVFTRNDQGNLNLMAVLSLEKDDNAHVGPKGLWMGGYVPVTVKTHPFAMAYQKNKAVLVFAKDSDWLTTDREQGQPLFDESGNPSPMLTKITDLLRDRFPSPLRDTPVMTAVDKAGLLEPWSRISDSLLCVNPEKLAGLDDGQFAALRQGNALAVIYAHLMSLPRINRIKNLASRKQRMIRQMKNKGQGIVMNKQADLDVSLDDDDMISFD